MPKKPTSRKSASAKDDPVRAEQMRLLKAQDEILRKQQELEKMIKDAPSRIQEQRRRNREAIRIQVAASATHPAAPRSLTDKFNYGNSTLRKRMPVRKAERNLAKVQFLVLVLILTAIAIMIWRVIP